MKQPIKEEGKEQISLRINNKTNQHCATNVLAVDNLESALKDFMKLSIDCGNNKSQFDHQQNSRIVEKSFKMYTTERLRFRPYEIPENILNANLQYKKQQSKEKDRDQQKISTAKTTSSTPQRNLMGIGLEGCNFPKAAISKTAIRPKPCWLQHQQRCGGAFRIVEKLAATDEEDELELKEVEQQLQPGIVDGEQQQPKPSPNPDLGLNELSDYFQHFVCLRAPKMSDLAQSMYA